MNTEKLYFLDEDDTQCWPLKDRLDDAKSEGLTEVTLMEAEPDDGTSGYQWCSYNGEVVENAECTKSNCSYYESNRGGRGPCTNRGKLYLHSSKVTFDVNTGKEIKREE